MSDEQAIDDGYAFPQSIEEARTKVAAVYGGLTKREIFAAFALAGLAGDKSVPCEAAANLAVRYADDLITRLKQ